MKNCPTFSLREKKTSPRPFAPFRPLSIFRSLFTLLSIFQSDAPLSIVTTTNPLRRHPQKSSNLNSCILRDLLDLFHHSSAGSKETVSIVSRSASDWANMLAGHRSTLALLLFFSVLARGTLGLFLSPQARDSMSSIELFVLGGADITLAGGDTTLSPLDSDHECHVKLCDSDDSCWAYDISSPATMAALSQATGVRRRKGTMREQDWACAPAGWRHRRTMRSRSEDDTERRTHLACLTKTGLVFFLFEGHLVCNGASKLGKLEHSHYSISSESKPHELLSTMTRHLGAWTAKRLSTTAR